MGKHIHLPNPNFPLEQWFDISRKITNTEVKTCEDQMALYAYKEGLEPNGDEWKESVRKLRLAVKQHNAKFIVSK